MNSPQNNPKVAKETHVSPRPTEVTRDGLGVPHLSTDPARRAGESSLEPDESVDLDETIRKDKDVADKEASGIDEP